MSIKTNYFDGQTYTAADDVAPWAALLADGTFGVDTGGLNVLASSPADLNVNVQPGKGIKNGYFVNSDSVVSVPIVANTSGYNRIDSIVIKIDSTNKITSIIAVQGIPSSSPTVPVLSSNQLLLANVLVGNNVSVINQNVITDARTNVELKDVSKSLNPIGYRKNVDGTIEEWGHVAVPSGAGTTINFPYEFPHACFSITANADAAVAVDVPYGMIKTNQFNMATSSGTTQTVMWRAVGY